MDEKYANNFGRKMSEGKRPLEDLGVDGGIILDWILGKQDGKVWDGFN
jgi:hypothetical protein